MWRDLISAPSAIEFQQKRLELHVKFDEEYYNLMSYLDDTWRPHQFKFATCWTKLWLHLGNTATS